MGIVNHRETKVGTDMEPVDITTMFFDDLKVKMYSQEYEQCPNPECYKYFEWKKLPNENVLTGREHEMFWGAPCSYETVEGYICPFCNEKVSF